MIFRNFLKKKAKSFRNFLAIFCLILFILSSFFINFFLSQEVQAHPGTRTKTIEFYVGQNYGTAGIASGTGATYDFTVYLPDAISSATVIRSAYLEYNTVISAVDATATAFQLGLVGSPTTLSSPAVIDQTGESQPVQMKLGATSVLQGIIQAPGTFNLRFTTSITGPVRYGENARLLITYDYNDAAATQIKTVYAWVHSQAATVASAGTVTSAIFNLGLPESTITNQSTFIETRGYVNAALTTGFYWNAETQRDIAWLNTTNSYGYVALVSPTTTYSPNTNNTFTIKSVTGAFSAPSAILSYTYSFDYSASTELMNSLKILLYQGTETASTATLSGNKVINIPESGITMKSSFLQGRAVNTNTAAMTSGMNAQLGSTPTTTGISFLANARETTGFRTIIWDVTSNLSTMAAGDNTVYWAYATSAATNIRGLVLFLNYKYNKANSSTFNSQTEWWVGQETAASTAWSQAFTPSIADSNYTLKSSYLNAQFNTNATTATTYTVGITTTGAYAFLTTTENTMGEVWRDTSSDVTGLGSSLTATLNGSNSTTKSASFILQFQNLPPPVPIDLTQYALDHATQIPVGGSTADTTVYFDFNVTSAHSTDVITPKVEVRDISTAFTNTATATGASFKYNPDKPKGRTFPATIYDSANKRLVMFGGKTGITAAGSATRVNEVWELPLPSADNPKPAWRKLSPTGGPPEARNAMTYIYDSQYNRMVIFGGYGAVTTYLQDFWVLDFSSSTEGVWTQFTPSGTLPSGRYSSAAIYDSANQRMVIFGGNDGADKNDTWSISLPATITNSASSQLSPSGSLPLIRSEHSLIYDSANQRMILFAGWGAARYNDTWKLDFAGNPQGTWTQLSPTGTLPGIRSGYYTIYDSQNQRMITGMGNSGTAYYNDIWELTLPSSGSGVWTEKTPPTGQRTSARMAAAGIYDPVAKRAFIFGGVDANYYLYDTISVNLPASGSFVYNLVAPKVNLTARDASTAIYDSLNQRMVIHGGFGAITDPADPETTGVHLNETWGLSGSGTAWKDIGPSIGPLARESLSGIYDSTNNRMIIFGGYGERLDFNDVWALSLSSSSNPSWTKLNPTGTGPSDRQAAAAIYDAPNQRMVIFGGYNTVANSYLKDVWELNFSSSLDGVWTNRTPASGGPATGRWQASSVYDPSNTRMIIFGGYDGTSYYNEVWELDFSTPGTETWTNRTPGTGPAGRRATTAIYQGDYIEKRMIIFGGYDGANHYNDVWKLNITTPGSESWTNVSPAGAPALRRSHVAVYNSNTQEMYVYGGRGVGTPVPFYNDTWKLTLQENTANWTWTQLSPTVYLSASLKTTGLTPGTSYHWQAWFTGSITGDSSKSAFGNNADSPLPAAVDFSITGGVPSVTLTIEGLASSQSLEGITTDVDLSSNPYSLDFGYLPIGGPSWEAASKFTISTNASSGYTLTVQQNQDLTSGGNTILPVSGTNASPSTWPASVTTGVFGYHTSDDSLGTGTTGRFTTDDTYAKFETTPYEIGYSGSAVTNEIIYMVYRIQVGVSQPTGTYTNTITYILTAAF